MTRYREVSQHPSKFLALTGYTVAEFQALLPRFQARFDAYIKTTTLEGKPRTRRPHSAYRNSPLPTLEDKLLFLLSYLKQGPTQEMHAASFGLYQPDANRWIHRLHPLLNQALADLHELPPRDAQAFQPAEGDLKVYFHDGTERPIPRPTNPDAQKLYYSGKKKQHTVKNVVVINASCKIRLLTPTCEGKKHDKKIADEAGYRLPDGSTLLQDTGFQGFTLVGVTILQPKKKPRGKELTLDEKEGNRLISKIRIRIEHAIGGVKRYRIVKDKLRNWTQGFRDKVMETCCGLHNFRLNFRPWHYDPLLV